MDLKAKVAAFLRKESKIAGVFDRNYYNSVYSDISKNKIDPVKHYFEFGSKEGRQPNGLFDPKYYRDKYLKGKKDVEPLFHYLSKEGKDNSPHPLFDVEYYRKQLTPEEQREIKTTFLEHFLKIGWKKGYCPTPYFDIDFYLSNNKDVELEDVNPLIHYLTFGEKEGRAPSSVFEPSFYEKTPKLPEDNYATYIAKTKLEFYALGIINTDYDYVDFISSYGQLEKEKPYILYVSHEGTRTGAPLIVLEIAKRFRVNYDVQAVNLLLRGGEITEDFGSYGPTYVCRHFRQNYHKFQEEVKAIAEVIDPKNLVAVIVNSAESRDVLPAFDQLGVPVISLVHEFAEFYPENSWQVIDDYSDLVIFPSNVVKEKATEINSFDPNKIIVQGQGLLNEKFLHFDREKARKIISKRIPLKKDTIIVLGCGTADPRKGIDFFVDMGTTYFSNKRNDKDVLFVWLGKLADNEHLNWSIKDVKRAGLEEQILFIGPASDPVPFFVGSDLFLMTSRADPFPCVVHEAMASSLPILCFDGGGGFVEALENDAGIILPYGDFQKSTIELEKLISDEEYRKRIGSNARKRLIEEYDFNKYNKFIAKIIYNTNLKNKRSLLGNMATHVEEANNKINSKEKKVIFTLPSWEAVSGVNTFVENLIIELRERDYDAYILFTYVKAETLAEEDPALLPKVPYRFLNTKKDDSGYECESIWKSLKVYLELNSPCVFVPNYDYIASAVSADLSSRIGILGVLHSDDVEHYEHGFRLGRYWNKTIAVSKHIAKKMIEINPLLEKRTSVIHCGVIEPIEKFSDIKKSENFKITYVGRIAQQQKKILDFIEIIKKLDERLDDFEFTFIGDGPHLEDLEEGLKEYIENGKVRLLGRQNKTVIYKELEKSTAFALFSDFEGLPISLLEAISVGCVPILTDLESGISEVIVHNENGLTSPIGDVEKYVENILLLASNEELQKKLSKNAFFTLKRLHLSRQDMAENYSKAIDEIFNEIESGDYQRPEPLTFGSEYGGILIPPMWQKVKRNIT